MIIFYFFWIQASFFIAYVVTSGWTSMASELARVVALISDFIGRHCSSKTNDEFHVPTIPYHSDIPKILFFGLLGITYFLLAPLILPFLLGFYCLGYIVYRNQVSRISIMFWLHLIVLCSFYHIEANFWDNGSPIVRYQKRTEAPVLPRLPKLQFCSSHLGNSL